MKKKDALVLFRSKFENKIPSDPSATKEFQELILTAISNYQKNQQASAETQSSDFSLQNLAQIFATMGFIKEDLIRLVFNTFKDNSFSLNEYNVFLSFLAEERIKPETYESELRKGITGQFFKVKDKFQTLAFFKKHLQDFVEKILLMLVKNITQINNTMSSDFVTDIPEIYQQYLQSIFPNNLVPDFLKEENCMLNECLRSIGVQQSLQNYFFDYYIKLIEETLHDHLPSILNNAIIDTKGIVVVIPKAYHFFCTTVLDEILLTPLKDSRSQKSTKFSLQRETISTTTGTPIMFPDCQQLIAIKCSEFLKTLVVVPMNAAKLIKEPAKQEIVVEPPKNNSFKTLARKSKFIRNSLRLFSSDPITSFTAEELTDKTKELTFSSPPNANSTNRSIERKCEFDDISAEFIINAMNIYINQLNGMSNEKEAAKKPTLALLEFIIQIKNMNHYLETLPILKVFYCRITEKFGKQELISDKCHQLLQEYKLLLIHDSEIYKKNNNYENFLSHVNNLPDKRFLEIVCYLDTDYLLNEIENEAKQIVKVEENTQSMSIFTARYIFPVATILPTIYQHQPKLLKQYKIDLHTKINSAIDSKSETNLTNEYPAP